MQEKSNSNSFSLGTIISDAPSILFDPHSIRINIPQSFHVVTEALWFCSLTLLHISSTKTATMPTNNQFESAFLHLR